MRLALISCNELELRCELPFLEPEEQARSAPCMQPLNEASARMQRMHAAHARRVYLAPRAIAHFRAWT
eukprot:6179678-Pleurochrysis_carterae.AAC.2